MVDIDFVSHASLLEEVEYEQKSHFVIIDEVVKFINTASPDILNSIIWDVGGWGIRGCDYEFKVTDGVVQYHDRVSACFEGMFLHTRKSEFRGDHGRRYFY